MKQFTFTFLILVAFIFLLSSCQDKMKENTTEQKVAFNLDSTRKIIEEINNEFEKAFISGDSARMVNQYTQDGKLFPPNSAAVIGSTAIGQLVAQYLKFGVKEFRDETTALYGNEDNLVEEGNYFMGDGKGNIIDIGKYIDIWRKVDGNWKVYSNMWNTSMPEVHAK